ncbi:MAG: uroporphyrinogen III synthase HEM4 [SAR86 cluster bacterium]|uniref:Uroporphyrinogen III synthase HEM4 n=1 Tax=SAR86 cluster bacterium TaxID=2030880 RepID=A0A2A5AB72_9GAMM|nr:MAG: uroporphyrinogen III synthase HEM4 [SAR86 cluster bacterium]
MPTKPTLASSLNSRVIALSESRQLDVLAALCERRQAQVMRVPLISILDTPDQEPIITWLKAFIAVPPDYLIVLTGEGLRRLLATAERNQLDSLFIDALGKVCKVCRGPKPARVLKEMNLKSEYFGEEPTTAGIISTLKNLELKERRVAVQLYGDDPNELLMDYLHSCELQSCSTVAPYIYASNSDDEKVQELILAMHAGQVDIIAFTSQPQVRRMFKVAKEVGLQSQLVSGFSQTKIAAVGPIVRDLLTSLGCRVDAMPTSSYFMKPLVRAMEELYSQN